MYSSDEERGNANVGARLVHEGQTVADAGEVEGPLPATDTLGFRWSAANDLFMTAGDVAADEWRASKATHAEQCGQGNTMRLRVPRVYSCHVRPCSVLTVHSMYTRFRDPYGGRNYGG